MSVNSACCKQLWKKGTRIARIGGVTSKLYNVDVVSSAAMSLLFAVVLVTVFSTGSQFSPPCTDLRPLDVLQYLVPDRNRLLPGLEIVYDSTANVHAYRFAGTATSGLYRFSFPAETLLARQVGGLNDVITRPACHFFPEEFSIMFSLKLHTTPASQRSSYNRDQCVFALTTRGSRRIRVSVRLYKRRLFVEYNAPMRGQGHVHPELDERLRRGVVTFKNVPVFDGQWHNLIVSITADSVTLQIDCRKRRQRRLSRQFPADIDIRLDDIHVGSCGLRPSSRFTGLLKELVLLPGSDISSSICPPGPSITSVWTTQRSRDLTQADDTTVWSSPDECNWKNTGRMSFDVVRRTLQICYSGVWQAILQPTEQVFARHMDFVVWHQDLVTSSFTVDLEVFSIPDDGLYLAAANNDRSEPHRKQQSTIYRWTGKHFVVHQSLYTLGAHSWEHFQIGSQFYLALATTSPRSDRFSKSIVYVWNKRDRRFHVHQELVTWTARDIEYFQIKDQHYLLIANMYADVQNNRSASSALYKWTMADAHGDARPSSLGRGQFVVVDYIEGLYGVQDWTYFTIDGYHFLAAAVSPLDPPVSNSFIDTYYSYIYLWQADQWIRFQTIKSSGARDWELFRVRDTVYLAVANAFNNWHLSDDRFVTNSTIYRFDPDTKLFEKYQHFVTNRAVDWESFTVGSDHYVIAAESHGDVRSTGAAIYRWQGVGKFVEVHRLLSLQSSHVSDWETFSFQSQTYLVYANALGGVSQVLKVEVA